MTDWLPASARLRVVVEQVAIANCGIAVGDSFEIDGSTMTTTGAFCARALGAVFPVLGSAQGALAADDWLARKPYVCCPEIADGVVMRVERLG